MEKSTLPGGSASGLTLTSSVMPLEDMDLTLIRPVVWVPNQIMPNGIMPQILPFLPITLQRTHLHISKIALPQR
jgi:hypothetical protein